MSYICVIFEYLKPFVSEIVLGFQGPPETLDPILHPPICHEVSMSDWMDNFPYFRSVPKNQVYKCPRHPNTSLEGVLSIFWGPNAFSGGVWMSRDVYKRSDMGSPYKKGEIKSLTH